MENDFIPIMQKKSDEELIKIVTIESNDYQPLAIAAAEEEIKSRNIDFSTMKKVRQEVTEKEEKRRVFIEKQVSLQLRFVNALIDAFVMFAIMFPLTFPLNANEPLSMFFGYFIILVVFLSYYIFLEYKFQQTIGKMITKTKVVTTNNEKPDIKTIIIRTLYRLMPIDNFSFLFVKNGFHDRFSDTSVVKK